MSDFVLQSSNAPAVNHSEGWPLLLKNYDKMNSRTNKYTPIPTGCTPLKRPILEYVKYGVINLDKPPRPSSHEVVTWVKNCLKGLKVEKTGHSGTLDPKVSGNLLVTIDRSTRLVKSQQNAGKEYIAVIRFHGKVEKATFLACLRRMQGPVYQRPPVVSAVVRRLRVRTLHFLRLLEYNERRGLGILHIRCQAGTYIRTLCIHLGILCGVGAHMQELRRVKSGHLGEKHNMVTMHDVRDACWLFNNTGDETYLRRIIMPLEVLLVHYKRIIVKDTSVNAICYGAKIMIPGLLRFDNDIEMGEEIVCVTTKGEGVCLAYAQMTTNQMASTDHGVVAKIKRVIMDRETYPKRWGLGPYAVKKKAMITDGTLDKYGKPNEKTPTEWQKQHPDFTNQEYYVKEEGDPIYDKSKNLNKPKSSNNNNRISGKKRSSSMVELESPPSKKLKTESGAIKIKHKKVKLEEVPPLNLSKIEESDESDSSDSDNENNNESENVEMKISKDVEMTNKSSKRKSKKEKKKKDKKKKKKRKKEKIEKMESEEASQSQTETKPNIDINIDISDTEMTSKSKKKKKHKKDKSKKKKKKKHKHKHKIKSSPEAELN